MAPPSAFRGSPRPLAASSQLESGEDKDASSSVVVPFDPHEQWRNHDRTLELMTPTDVEELGFAIQSCANIDTCLLSQVAVETDRPPFHILDNTYTVLAHNCWVLAAGCGIALGDRNPWGPISMLLDTHTATGM